MRKAALAVRIAVSSLGFLGCSDPTTPGLDESGLVGTWYQSVERTGLKRHGSSGYLVLWESPGGDSALAYGTELEVRGDLSCILSIQFQYWDVPRSPPWVAMPLVDERLSLPCQASEWEESRSWQGNGRGVRGVRLAYATRSGTTHETLGFLRYEESDGFISEKVYSLSMQLPPREVLLDAMNVSAFGAVPLGSVVALPEQMPVLAYNKGYTLR